MARLTNMLLPSNWPEKQRRCWVNRFASNRWRPAWSFMIALQLFLLVVAVLCWRTNSKLHVIGEPKYGQSGMQDFRDVAYLPTVSFLAGENPYDAHSYLQHHPAGNPFPLYAPTTILMHLPFGIMPQRFGEILYCIIGLLLVLVLAKMSLQIADSPTSSATILGLAMLILLSRPGHQNFVLGQLTLPMVIFSILALKNAKLRPRRAGIWVALAVSKPTFGVPILVLMLCRKNYKAFAYGCGIAFAVNAALLLFIAHNNGGIAEVIATLTSNASEFRMQDPAGHPVLSFSRIDLLSTFSRLTKTTGPEWTEAGLLLFTVITAGIVWNRKIRTADGDQTAYAGLPCVAILLSIYHQPHDMLLLVPYTVCLWKRINNSPWLWSRDAIVFAILAFVFANYGATGTVLGLITKGSHVWLTVTSINGVLLAIVCGILCLPRFPDREITTPAIDQPGHQSIRAARLR